MMTVSSLNTKIKSLLEATFMHTLVEGEVASVTYHSSGHLYFSIKDDKSSIKCVMWRSSVARMKFRIEKGMHIVVEGSVSVYVPRGEYQLQAVKVEPYGEGALALAYEQLKTKLKEQGYFEASRKKPIPKYIQKLVLVTAKESAALHDMLKIIEKRWPLLEVVIVDTLVQGEHAGAQIANSLTYADSLGADVVVVGRGGGSAEDLWAFNEEVVADTLFAMQTPVVSAVGHEVDILISDFVADLRAPTPSAAMEMVLPDGNEILMMLDDRMEQYRRRLQQILSSKEHSLSSINAEYARSSVSGKLIMLKEQFGRLEQEFISTISFRMEQITHQVEPIALKLSEGMDFVFRNKRRELDAYRASLLSLNPSKQLRESWVQINKNSQKISLNDIGIGDEFDLLSDKVKMRVKSIKKETL